MILTNCWKIYESLYGPFLSSTQKRRPGAHREFLEALVELLFLCNSEKYAETALGTSFKDYQKYSYISHKPGFKPRFPESTSSDFTNISRETPFIFKGNPGRPRVSVPAKITPISRHQHIKIIIREWCLICRDSEKIYKAQIAKEESIVYEIIFKVSEETLNEVLRPFKGPKRIRGKSTFWKCNECAVPIYRPGKPCWDIAYRRLFSK